MEEMEEANTPKGYAPAPKIDLSKIANMGATQDAGIKIAENAVNKAKAKKARERKAKFNFSTAEKVKLPTGRFLYGDSEDPDLAEGYVNLSDMSLADEELLTNQSLAKRGETFVQLLNSCVQNEGFDANELSIYDTYYLLYALRRITYGEDYEFEVKCEHCGKKFKYKMNIEDAEFDEIPEDSDLKPVVTLELPKSHYTVTIRYAALGDEAEVKRLSPESDVGDVALGYAVRTLSIKDDKGKLINPQDYEEFYSQLPGRDRAMITKAFEDLDNLEIPKMTITCPKCKDKMEKEIPFDKDFFRY